MLSLDKNRQINPILHFGDLPLLIRELRKEFARLGFEYSEKQMREAVRIADQAENEFKSELYAEGDKFLRRVEQENTQAYVGVGRDYVILDPEASSSSGAMFSQVRGLDYIPQQFLEHRFQNISLDEFVENEFWNQSVKIMQANVFIADHPNLFAIRMINFACGPDSLKIYQEEQIHLAVGKPLLILVTDGQTNNAPFVTRTEAHERVVSQSRPVRLDIDKLKIHASNTYDKRIWLVPYMGDASHVAGAGQRHIGIDGKVLPTNTPRGYEAARKHVSTEVCYPLKGVVGDAIGYLQEQIEQTGLQAVEDKYLVMLPTTSGPCRFGKYSEVLRHFMKIEGLEKIPVVGPSSETDYIDIPLPGGLKSSATVKMQQILFKGINAADLLEDVVRRFRPYAQDKPAVDAMKAERLEELGKLVTAGADVKKLQEWGRETVSMFKAIKLRHHERFPLILYIGEIYMRQHDPYTDFVIHRLEDNGLEVVRDPITDWLFYVNKMNLRNARRDMGLGFKGRDFGRLLRSAAKAGKSVLKGKYMGHVADKLAEPFHGVLEGRHVLPHPMEIIETLEAAHETHGNIEGESPLSTGIAYYLMHEMVHPTATPTSPASSTWDPSPACRKGSRPPRSRPWSRNSASGSRPGVPDHPRLFRRLRQRQPRLGDRGLQGAMLPEARPAAPAARRRPASRPGDPRRPLRPQARRQSDQGGPIETDNCMCFADGSCASRAIGKVRIPPKSWITSHFFSTAGCISSALSTHMRKNGVASGSRFLTQIRNGLSNRRCRGLANCCGDRLAVPPPIATDLRTTPVRLRLKSIRWNASKR